MPKNKSASYFSAVVDDVKAGPFSDIQNKLDELQDGGITALAIHDILFQKMLDLHRVPTDHFLRTEDSPFSLDDPKLVQLLNELGFHRENRCNLH